MGLFLAFSLACLLTFFSHAQWPEFPLMAFSPFLALVCLRAPLLKSLWLAVISGLFLDLLSSGERLGFYLLPYLLTLLLLHRYRKHFFEDRMVSFSLYCASISSVTTLWMALFSLVSGPRFTWTWEFFAVDLLLLPCFDGVIGFVLFVLPSTIIHLLKKTIRLRWVDFRLRDRLRIRKNS
jgi:hypothetical protein